MPSNFCFHVYAQNLLLIGKNGNDFSFTSSPSPVSVPIIELVLTYKGTKLLLKYEVEQIDLLMKRKGFFFI